VWSFVPVALLALVVAANVLVSKCLDIWEKVVENGGTPPPATSCWPGGAAGTGVIVGQSR
jgi:hypothetical protein